MDDIKLLAKIKKEEELEDMIWTKGMHSQDTEMKFCIEKMCHAVNEK